MIVVTDLGMTLSSRDREHLIAHEVFHCFQKELAGLDELPGWLKEGSAEWAASELVASDTFAVRFWRPYFIGSQSLFDQTYDSGPAPGRTYTAVGLFGHLKYQGADVWNVLNTLLTEYSGRSRNSQEMFDRLLTLAGSKESLLQTWPMGIARNPRAGRNWDTEAPSIVPDHARRRNLPSDSSARLPTAMPLLFETVIPSGKVVTITVEEGFGAILIGDNTTRVRQHFERKYCLLESCQCDDGSAPLGLESTDTGEALIALTSHLTEGRLEVTLSEPPCDSDEEASSTPPSRGGTRATSHSDPHIVTFDRYRYSFHTVGEFWLSRSTDGRFAVQVRQSSIPARRQLALNSAIAMQVGDHRVAIYAQDAPDGETPLWIDGVPTPLWQGTRRLAGGGSITSNGRNQYMVRWPTDEQVAVRVLKAGRASFLNITPWIPNEYAGRLEGLLGDFNGDPSDDLRIRDGRVIPSKNAYAQVVRLLDSAVATPLPLTKFQNAFFKRLYSEFGGSWRISDLESLFDYAPGTSTETFTDRAFPSSYPTLFGVPKEEIEKAKKLCQMREVADEFMEGCVFDVAATGQRGFAESAAYAVIDVLVDEAKVQVKKKVKEKAREKVEDKLDDRLKGLLRKKKWF